MSHALLAFLLIIAVLVCPVLTLGVLLITLGFKWVGILAIVYSVLRLIFNLLKD